MADMHMMYGSVNDNARYRQLALKNNSRFHNILIEIHEQAREPRQMNLECVITH